MLENSKLDMLQLLHINKFTFKELLKKKKFYILNHKEGQCNQTKFREGSPKM